MANPSKPQSPNWRSKLITEGVSRSPNRAMLRAVGFGDNDFKKPIVGVANGHSTITPCNSGLQKLADAAIAQLDSAVADCGLVDEQTHFDFSFRF